MNSIGQIPAWTCAALLALPTGVSAAAKTRATIPDWALPAIADTSGFAADADAIVSFEELDARVTRNGHVFWHGRRVMRVRTNAGREHAICRVYYVEGQGKPPELTAMLVRATDSGTATALGKALDVVAGGVQVRSEVRSRVLDASGRANAGDVLISEWTQDDAPPFLDFDMSLSTRLPVLKSVFRVDWPAEWKLTSRWLPDGAPDSLTGPGTRTWEFSRLDARGSHSTASHPQLHRIALSFMPDRPLRARTFPDWAAVSGWLCEIASGRDAGSPVAARASALVDGRPGEMDRLMALAGPPQKARYIAIQTGLGRGGGYRPRPAVDVLEFGYGDCKDKANLFCALARSAGFRAWLVVAYAGNRDYVCAIWPSPQQFNHCIAAVSVSDTLNLPAVLEHPRLGPLLFFDPTDPDTPLGELPEGLQGSLVLVADGDRGELVRLPESLPDQNTIRWEIRGDLRPDGTARGVVSLEAIGAPASEQRALRRVLGESEYALATARRVARRAAGTSLEDFGIVSARNARLLRAEGRWSTPAFGRVLSSGRLAVGAPVLGNRAGIVDALTDADSEFEPRLERDIARIRLPSGYRLSAAPADTQITAPLVRYERRTRLEGDTIVIEKSWTRTRRGSPGDSLDVLRGDLRRVDAVDRALWLIAPADSTD